jgi:hypothetical protein
MDVIITLNKEHPPRRSPGARGMRAVPGGFEDICREFPNVEISVPSAHDAGPRVQLRAEDWDAPWLDLYAFDRTMDELALGGPAVVGVMASDCTQASRVTGEVLTRCQRLFDRRNEASRTARFDELLGLHRSLHDLDKPLVLADYRHALDTWQWVLRLDCGAGEAVQMAALFHDIERLISEACVRVEHHACDYHAFKQAHAHRGAELTDSCLEKLGVDIPTRIAVTELIAKHERSEGDGDIALLNDGDALSFFSLNSAGFLDYYGEEHARRKVAYTLRRLRPAARSRLRGLRYRPEIAQLVRELSAELMD